MYVVTLRQLTFDVISFFVIFFSKTILDVGHHWSTSTNVQKRIDKNGICKDFLFTRMWDLETTFSFRVFEMCSRQTLLIFQKNSLKFLSVLWLFLDPLFCLSYVLFVSNTTQPSDSKIFSTNCVWCVWDSLEKFSLTLPLFWSTKMFEFSFCVRETLCFLWLVKLLNYHHHFCFIFLLFLVEILISPKCIFRCFGVLALIQCFGRTNTFVQISHQVTFLVDQFLCFGNQIFGDFLFPKRVLMKTKSFVIIMKLCFYHITLLTLFFVLVFSFFVVWYLFSFFLPLCVIVSTLSKLIWRFEQTWCFITNILIWWNEKVVCSL